MKQNKSSDMAEAATGLKKLLKQVSLLIHLIEDSFLVLLLSSIIVLSVSQIIMRNVFEGGFSWADTLLRLLVLWVGLVGAMVATRQDHQLTIDIVTRSLPRSLKTLVRIVSDILSAFVCTLIAYHGWRFLMMDKEAEVILFAEVPAWWGEVIIPLAFGVIALRYLIFAGEHSLKLFNEVRG